MRAFETQKSSQTSDASYHHDGNSRGSLGSFVFRRVAPLIVAISIFMGGLHIIGEQRNLFSNLLWSSLIIGLLAAFLIMVTWLVACELNKIEENKKRTEKSLFESEAKYKQLIQNAIAGIASHKMIFDEEGKPVDYIFLSANEAFEKQTGLKVKDIIGRRVTEILPGIEKSDFLETYGKVVLTGESISFEQYSEPLDRHYFVNAYCVSEGCFAVAFNDITEQKRVHLALKKNQAFLSKLLETMPTPVFYKDTDGRYLGVNKAFEDITGKSKEELIGKNVFDSYPYEVAKIYHQMDERLFEQGDVQIYTAHIQDGNEVSHDVVLYRAPFLDENNQVAGIIGVILDVTERKQAEDALKKNEAFLTLLLETIPIPIFYKDREGKFAMVNKAFQTLCWKEKKDIIGKTVFDLYEHDFALKAQAEDKILFELPGERAYFTEIKDGLGTLHNLIIQKVALVDDLGDVTGLIGSILDVTDIKRTEEELNETRLRLKEANLLANNLAKQIRRIG